IAEPREDGGGVVTEPVGGIAVEPSATVVQRRGKVPMKERGVRANAVRQQLVDEVIVEVEAPRVDCADALGEDAAPADAEAIRLESQLAHERHVVAPSAVVIARDVPSLSVRRAAGGVRKPLPNARTGAVGERTAFYLVRRRRGAPEKSSRKLMRFAH